MKKLKVSELKEGDWIFYNRKPFFVDYIELEFKNKSVSKLYDDEYEGEVKPEHTKYTLSLLPPDDDDLNFVKWVGPPPDYDIEIGPFSHLKTFWKIK